MLHVHTKRVVCKIYNQIICTSLCSIYIYEWCVVLDPQLLYIIFQSRLYISNIETATSIFGSNFISLYLYTVLVLLSPQNYGVSLVFDVRSIRVRARVLGFTSAP